MSELSLAITELQRCGEALIGISKSLAGLFSGNEEVKVDQPKAETHATEGKPITLESVRAVLAEKSRAGHTAKVRELLEKHGAAKLSEIAPDKYADLLAEAEVLGNG
ncbi:DNA ligase [Dehalococcoides sp. THU3]|uniref:DNA ligase n=1 Tax=Dehalococcoides TaxID=61434 RepID=UPI003218C22D